MAIFPLGAHLVALEVDADGAPCVVFLERTACDLDAVLVLPGHVLTELDDSDGQPVSITRDGRAVTLTANEIHELTKLYAAALGLLSAYQDWLAERSQVVLPLTRWAPATVAVAG
jgi:hypothetical protein